MALASWLPAPSAAALTPFWWLIKSIMHLGLQVACGTNGGRAPQTGCSSHHQRACHQPLQSFKHQSPSRSSPCHAPAAATPPAPASWRLLLPPLLFLLFFYNKTGLGCGNNSYAPYAALAIHQPYLFFAIVAVVVVGVRTCYLHFALCT